MLKLENVSFSYQDKKVLDNFSLEIKDGECICLKGDSGCGKTTVARLLLGLEKAQEGIVTAPKKISCVFQEDRLLDHLTVLKNIFLVIPKKREKLVLELATELGLQDSLKLKISELSGGMKRRVAIIKAIAFSGDALILDEAFNGLDLENKIKIANIIKREFTAKSKPVLMITHVQEDAELLDAKIINFTQKNPLF
jgi:ABC-type nitrate/sulfonate/bicarbonate transport system ATPase subunit